MKIYTEIVYTWNEEKGELVEESSKSFEYQGEISQCHRKRYPHPHGGIGGALYEAGTDIGEGALDILGDITGAAGGTGSSLTETITKSGQKAWSEMSTYAGDLWEKGGAAVTDIWQGTGMEDMAAKWTDPQAMKDAWMPGKWAADSPFQSKWMMGIDMLKHKEGFHMWDFAQYRQNLFEEFDRWEDAANTNIATANEGIETAVETTTENLEGIIEDNNDSLADLESGINTNIASGNEAIENIIAENTDSLNDLESGINTTVADTVELAEAGIENIAIGAGALEQGADLIGQGTSVVLDSTINPNNENSLVFNPVNWWQEVEGSGKGGWDFLPFGLMADEEDLAETTGGIIQGLYGGGDYDPYGGGGGGTGSYDPGGGYGTGLGPGITTELTGSGRNPFAMSGDQRRLIQEEKKFPQQTGNVAPSLINRNKKLLA
jgi:hypothetical protein